MLVLDDSAIAEARLLHPTREGFFTVAQRHAPKANGQVWSESSYAMSSLEQILGAVQNVPDLFISQASFATKRRGNAMVKEIGCSFADLDCYKLGIIPDDATVMAILKQSADAGMPEPSYVMSSGRGLYAKWIFDQPVSGALLPHWQKLQNVLGHLFLAFGADANARDLSRVLRASSTTNSKNGETVRVIHQSGKRYRFIDLAAQAAQIKTDEFIQSTKNVQRRIRVQQDSLITIPADLPALINYSATREPAMMERFGRQSLNWTRFIDLRDLMIRRGGASQGCRDVFLFWMTATLASADVIDPNNFWGEVGNLLSGFPLTKDFDPLHDGSLESLRSRIERHSRGEKIAFDGNKVSPIYTPSNDYLINVLNITDEEQEQLKTIISSEEKRRRSDLKNKGRSERRVERTESRIMAVQLQREGLSTTEISEKIGVHRTTVGRWLAPTERNKTRGHDRYMAQKWDAQQIEGWLAKRKETQAEREHKLELMREQRRQLNAAKEAQDHLKISVQLMTILQKARDKVSLSAGDMNTATTRKAVIHPFAPPDARRCSRVNPWRRRASLV